MFRHWGPSPRSALTWAFFRTRFCASLFRHTRAPDCDLLLLVLRLSLLCGCGSVRVPVSTLAPTRGARVSSSFWIARSASALWERAAPLRFFDLLGGVLLLVLELITLLQHLVGDAVLRELRLLFQLDLRLRVLEPLLDLSRDIRSVCLGILQILHVARHLAALLARTEREPQNHEG